MFSSAARIARRTGAYGTPRKEYFVELIEEFGSTKSAEHRAQVVAHLANFAYDPINYSLLLALNVPELFVDASRKDKEPEMSAAAMQGIANLSAGPPTALPRAGASAWPTLLAQTPIFRSDW